MTDTLLPLRQCFAWWSFAHGRDSEAETLLRGAASAGMSGVEMLPQALWPLARDAGLDLVTGGHGKLEEGFNDPANYNRARDEVRRGIDDAVNLDGPRKLIVFAGTRREDDAQAIDIMVQGLRPVVEEAEAAGVTLLLELLNSKVDHPGNQCDRSDWGAAVVSTVASPALRLLFDIYHMQIMEGDVSRSIKRHSDLIDHIHTAGVPGRHDLDDRQEVNWRGIAGLLRHLNYRGWVGHEFIPRGDSVAALRHAAAHFE